MKRSKRLFIILFIIGMYCIKPIPISGLQKNVRFTTLASDTERMPNEIDMGEYQSEMVVGERQLLNVTVLPLDATNQTITYASSNKTVATINGLGRITAIAVGESKITAKCGNIEESFVLTVKKKEESKVLEIDLGDYQTEMTVGDRQLLMASILPTDAANQTIQYQSDNPLIASVSSSGRITALKKGKAKITATCGGIESSFDLTVKQKESESKVLELDLGDYQKKMALGETQLLYVTAYPNSIANPIYWYRSSKPNIASINRSGRITALKVGKTRITATCQGVKGSFWLQVTKEREGEEKVPVKKVEIGSYEKEMEVDKTQTLSVSVLPSNATDSTVTYTSSNESIATVNSSGEVKGLSKGKVTITVKAGKKTKKAKIDVRVATRKIELNHSYLVLKTGENVKLSSTVIPSNAVQNVTYKSEDEGIADVTADGMVTAKGMGSTSILASNGDISSAATVIVNKEENETASNIQRRDVRNVTINSDSSLTEKEEELIHKIMIQEDVIHTPINEFRVLTKNILKKLYEEKATLLLEGDDYSIVVSGEKIKNYENELDTIINFKKDGQTSFLLNNGNQLPGMIELELKDKDSNLKHLYLYNEVKKKYELLDGGDTERYMLDEAGKYLIAERKLSNFKINILALVISFIVLFGLFAGYVIVKRQYWFW